MVGQTGRRQAITLARGCWYPGIVAHEIGELLGLRKISYGAQWYKRKRSCTKQVTQATPAGFQSMTADCVADFCALDTYSCSRFKLYRASHVLCVINAGIQAHLNPHICPITWRIQVRWNAGKAVEQNTLEPERWVFQSVVLFLSVFGLMPICKH